MIVLGIDPGYAIVGCGVVEYKNNHFTMLDYGAVTTPAGMPFNIRLERIYDGVSELMEKYNPEAMSIEKLFYNNNAKNGYRCQPGEGEFLFSPRRSTVSRFLSIHPCRSKQSVVGYGRAEKKQVQEMTRIIPSISKKSRSPMTPPTRSLWRSATAIAAARSWADSASTDKGEQHVFTVSPVKWSIPMPRASRSAAAALRSIAVPLPIL